MVELLNSSTTKSKQGPAPCINALADWLYLPEGRSRLLTRMVVAVTVLNGPYIWLWASAPPGPYFVPAWRFQDHLLYLPLPDSVKIVTFAAGLISCLFLFFGIRPRIFAAIPASVVFYFASRDIMGLANILALNGCFLAALVFYKPGLNCCRRLIQLTICSCYFFASLQRLTCPDFINGNSLAAWFNAGDVCQDWLATILKTHPPPEQFWLLFSWLILGTELFLSIGLLLPKRRKLALFVGTALHLGIAATLTFLFGIFSLLMLAGYCAFLPGKTKEVHEQGALSKRPLETLLAFAFIALLIAVPSRIYFDPQLPVLSQFDRLPCVSNMFILRTQKQSLQIRYQKADGTWADVPLIKGSRMESTAADTELYSLRDWVFANHTDAERVTVSVELLMNLKWKQYKDLDAQRHGPTTLKVRSELRPN